MKTTFNEFIENNEFYQINTRSKIIYGYEKTVDEDGFVIIKEINREIAEGSYEPPIVFIPITSIEYMVRLTQEQKYKTIESFMQPLEDKLYRLSEKVE